MATLSPNARRFLVASAKVPQGPRHSTTFAQPFANALRSDASKACLVVRVFERLGWATARRKGSHIILTKAGNPATLSVPDHDVVARGTLRSLIARAGLSVEAFLSRINS